MDKKNSKHLKANKTNMNNTNSKVEFANELSLNTSKKSNKHNSNKHSNYCDNK